MSDDVLFPYATTSRFKPWKQRVFVFSKDAVAPSELEPWPVQIPPHGVWPEHLQDGPRQAFFDWFISIEKASVAQVMQGFSLSTDAVGDPTALDKIGDRILELIEFSPEAEKNRISRVKKWGEGMPDLPAELMWQPIWNTILIDLAHFVAAGVKKVYAKANPRWDLIDPKFQPTYFARNPFLKMDNAKIDLEYAEEDAFFKKLIESDLSLLEDQDRWFEMVEPELVRRGFDLDEVDFSAYRPENFLQPIGESAAFDPIFALSDFFRYAFVKRHDFKDPYGYEEGLRSLGDILRPRDQAGWIGFPQLNL